MKKIFLAAFFFLFLALGQTQAAGLVPCGEPGNECQLCDFFVMINGIFQFVVIKMVPVIAVLMITIGGIYYFFAGADPGALETGKKILTSTIWGLIIIFSAFLLIGTILNAIGLASWTQDIYRNWWQEGFFRIPGC